VTVFYAVVWDQSGRFIQGYSELLDLRVIVWALDWGVEALAQSKNWPRHELRSQCCKRASNRSALSLRMNE
jgi:hypothetical protein